MVSKKSFSPRLAFVLIFGIFLIVMAYVFYFSPTTNPKPTTPDALATIQGLEKALDVKSEIKDSIYVDWKMPDGALVPLTSKQIILGTTGVNGLGQYGNLTTDQLDQLDVAFLTPLADSIKKYYEDNGFTQSPENTNMKPNDLWAMSIGYEKDGLYCVSNLAQHSDPFAYLSCGTIDTDQMALQKELNSILVEAKAQEKDSPVPLIFRVDKVEGDFASGSISSLGGYQWIAQNTDGTWKRVWAGNDMPLCSDMEKYNVPKSFYPGCYDPNTQTVIQ